jgi:hypothetical protein
MKWTSKRWWKAVQMMLQGKSKWLRTVQLVMEESPNDNEGEVQIMIKGQSKRWRRAFQMLMKAQTKQRWKAIWVSAKGSPNDDGWMVRNKKTVKPEDWWGLVPVRWRRMVSNENAEKWQKSGMMKNDHEWPFWTLTKSEEWWLNGLQGLWMREKEWIISLKKND